MRKLGMMALILLGALTMLATNYALAQPQKSVEECVKARLDAIDTNNDGKISHDEYVAKSENRFKAMDTNNDGSVSSEEFKEACKKKWEEKKAKGHPCPLAPKATPAESKQDTSK
jgi:hypothetical protein